MSLQEWYEGATEEDLACEDFLNGAVVPWADLAFTNEREVLTVVVHWSADQCNVPF
jgi:hypothetical protein